MMRIIMIGTKLCTRSCDAKRPRKYAEGEYILLASSRVRTGTWRGICIMESLEAQKHI